MSSQVSTSSPYRDRLEKEISKNYSKKKVVLNLETETVQNLKKYASKKINIYTRKKENWKSKIVTDKNMNNWYCILYNNYTS